jgi:hypothetical protein
MTTITKSITFRWNLLDVYAITTDRKIYNKRTMREIKRCVNGYSVGYYLGGKFYTLDKINKLAKPIINKIPF